MRMLTASLLGGLLAYLIGSVSPAYFAGRARGLDLRFEGSETLGFRNAAKVLGRQVGALVFLADFLKGQLAVGLAVYAGASPLAIAAAGAAVVAGQLWPLFHGFSGGRGLATAAGVLLALSPWSLLICLTLMILFASLLGRAAHAELLTIGLLPAVILFAEKGDLSGMLLGIGLACLLVAARWREVETLLGARKADEDED